MTDLTLYTHPMSRGRIVRWMLEELAVPYKTEIMTFGQSIKAPDYLAINPMGKVPAIKHGDTVVTEVSAILAYLADRFPEKGLAPAPHSAERGPYYRWLFFMAGPFEMATTAQAYDWRIDDSNVEAVGCGRLQHVIQSLEQALSKGPYVCGEQFTAADVLVSSFLWWEMNQKHLPPNALFEEYVNRMESRPASKRANQIDDELVEQMNAAIA